MVTLSSRAIRRAALGLLAVGLGLSGLQLGGWLTPGLALMEAQTALPANTFTTRLLSAPTELTAIAAGVDLQLSWAAGGGGTGYMVARAANGGSSDCAGAAFSDLAAVTDTAYTDVSYTGPAGDWVCYRVTTTAGSWTNPDPSPTVAVQLGP